MIGYGLSLPVLPFFLQELAQGRSVTSTAVSLHVGSITAVFALMQMLFAPLWGRLSDHSGTRRPILLLGLAGYAASMALAGISKNIFMLYGARMLNGTFSAAVLPIASAYIVDAVPEKHRARGLAWHGTAVGLGVVTGPALGAFLGDLVDKHPVHLDLMDVNAFSAPFFLASALAFLAVFIAGFWLPASTTVKINEFSRSKPYQAATANSAIDSGSKVVVVWLLLAFTGQFALSLFESTFVLHAREVMSFSIRQLGYVFMVCGFVMAVAQGTVVAGIIERYSPEKILPPGFLCMGGGLMALMVTREMNLVLVSVGVLAIGMATITPGIAVLISGRETSRIGRNLGLLTGTNSLGQIIGPLLGSMLFVYNIHLPYLLAAGALFAAAAYCFFPYNITHKKKLEPLLPPDADKDNEGDQAGRDHGKKQEPHDERIVSDKMAHQDKDAGRNQKQ
jgi:DHA1 family multidrug resistance protein-like MFS transporter